MYWSAGLQQKNKTMAQIHSLLSSFAALNLGKQDLHFRIRNFKARSVSVHSHYKHTIKLMCR